MNFTIIDRLISTKINTPGISQRELMKHLGCVVKGLATLKVKLHFILVLKMKINSSNA